MVEKKEACKASQSSRGGRLPPCGHLQDMCTWGGPQAEEAPGGGRRAQGSAGPGRRRETRMAGARPRRSAGWGSLAQMAAAAEAWPAAGNLLLASAPGLQTQLGACLCGLRLTWKEALSWPAGGLSRAPSRSLGTWPWPPCGLQHVPPLGCAEPSHALCLQRPPPTATGPPPSLRALAPRLPAQEASLIPPFKRAASSTPEPLPCCIFSHHI